MNKKGEKRSWLDKLRGSGPDGFDTCDESFDDAYDEIDEYDDGFDDELEKNDAQNVPTSSDKEDLNINLIDKGNVLIAQALVPGLEDADIDVNLTREMLTVETESNEHRFDIKGDYLYDEVTYGSFFRSMLLPAEIEVEESTAEVKDGILTITMPKIDKDTKRKLSIKKK